MEVCVESLSSAIIAERAGAKRIELCSCLQADGVTPSMGLLREVKKKLSIPVVVLIRPRDGDFCYSEDEVKVMTSDVKAAIENGADGVAIGALTTTGTIDKPICRALVDEADGKPVTFHRAFDLCNDFSTALEDIIELGCCRLLTSGCAVDALSGLPIIRKLVSQSQGRIHIMPGGGITKSNLAEILRTSGAKEFHTSASIPKLSTMKLPPSGPKFKDLSKPHSKECSLDKATTLLGVANTVWMN